MEKRVHLSAFRSEFLFDGSFRVFQQRVVFRVVRDQVGGNGFSAVEDFASTMLAPGLTEKQSDLVT